MSAVVKAIKKLGIKARVEEFSSRVQVITQTRIEAEEAKNLLIAMKHRDVMVTVIPSEKTFAVEAYVPEVEGKPKARGWYV